MWATALEGGWPAVTPVPTLQPPRSRLRPRPYHARRPVRPRLQPVEDAPRPARLRARLVVSDVVGAAIGWSLAIALAGPRGDVVVQLLALVTMTAVTLAAVASRQLYQARVSRLRSQEIQHLAHAVIVAGLVGVALAEGLGALRSQAAAIGVPLSFLSLFLGRSLYRGWLEDRRRAGHFHRRVVLVGTNDEARHLHRLFHQHPEHGVTVIGAVGPQPGAPLDDSDLPVLGQVEDVVAAVRLAGASGVVVAATSLPVDVLNSVVRRLMEERIHVQLSNGLAGIAHGRLRADPVAHEPLFYVERVEVALWQRAVKRTMDLVLGGIALVASLPVLAMAALAIKLDDGGPIFFRQDRVGTGGRPFRMIKLRTMIVDAEKLYEELACTHAGRSGPLVKLRSDPRHTRVGRLLRATSVDELPQLIHVLSGRMSLVGPRPNLLVEAESLDPGFIATKTSVRPGITGLWQVEARDNPYLDAYRRLDVFYVENWSLSLDVAVLFATVEHLVRRLGILLRNSSGLATSPVME